MNNFELTMPYLYYTWLVATGQTIRYSLLASQGVTVVVTTHTLDP